MQSVAIPRGQVVLAGGHAAPDATTLTVSARRGDTEYGICSTGFLEHAFRTDAYRLDITFNPDGSWSYVSEVTLAVHGQAEPFIHRDKNRLIKVSEAESNPLAKIAARAAKDS